MSKRNDVYSIPHFEKVKQQIGRVNKICPKVSSYSNEEVKHSEKDKHVKVITMHIILLCKACSIT